MLDCSYCEPCFWVVLQWLKNHCLGSCSSASGFASRLALHLAHMNGPSHDSFPATFAKNDPACTEIPVSEAKLQRQLAHRNRLFPACTDPSGDNLIPGRGKKKKDLVRDPVNFEPL